MLKCEMRISTFAKAPVDKWDFAICDFVIWVLGFGFCDLGFGFWVLNHLSCQTKIRCFLAPERD